MSRTHLSRLLVILLLQLAHGAQAADPHAQPDNSYISISGTIAAATSNAFILDYGEGTITVEMDDWDSHGDAYALSEGDQVTVYGRIDNHLYETATIEAGSVYVKGLNAYYYASGADEEDPAAVPGSGDLVLGNTTVQGTVSSIDPPNRTFTLDTGKRRLVVHTRGMDYNPLDDAGFQQIGKGDRVSVTGSINRRFFQDRLLQADAVVTLRQAGSP